MGCADGTMLHEGTDDEGDPWPPVMREERSSLSARSGQMFSRAWRSRRQCHKMLFVLGG
jgi:hypothetical protein